jgi:hypothetical protein
MGNIIDDEKLKSIFNMDEDESIEPVLPTPPTEVVPLTPEAVFGELQQLIRSGNNMLSTVEHVISSEPDNPELYQGASSLLNSIKDTMKEFTKVYMEDKRHHNKMELEMLKITARENLVKQKFALGAIDAEGKTLDDGKIPFNQEAIISYLEGGDEEDDIED